MDKPLTKESKDNQIRALDGCICRICVSDNPLEIIRMVGFANDYIATLAQSRMLQLKERDDES